MTEDKTILLLKRFLEKSGWEIGSNFSLGHKHGYDIKAIKNDQVLIVEAKGARANDSAYNKKREQFDSGQLKTHFGKALIKILEEKTKNPKYTYAIAHPDDDYIRFHIGGVTKYLKKLGIIHYWVKNNGDITEE